MHRAIRPDEPLTGAFVIRRSVTDGGDRILEWSGPRKYSPRGRKINRAPAGVTKRIAELLSKAAAMRAMGKTRDEAAAELGVRDYHIVDWRNRYPDLWKTAYDRAMERIKTSVLAQSGTLAVLENPSSFLSMAERCHEWSHARGENLLPETAEMTLPQFYEEHYLPACLGDGQESTICLHRTLLRRWALLTRDPPLTKITNETMVFFRNCLAKMRGMKPKSRISPNTVRTYLRNIETFLSKAGPPGRGNRDAFGFIAQVPWVRPPRPVFHAPRFVSDQSLSRVYEAAARMELPRYEGFSPAAWWRALLVTAYNTGLRRGSLFRLRMDQIDWSNGILAVPPDGNRKVLIGLVPAAQCDGPRAFGGDPYRSRAPVSVALRHDVFRQSFSPPAGRCRYAAVGTFRIACIAQNGGHGPLGALSRRGSTDAGSYVEPDHAGTLRQ